MANFSLTKVEATYNGLRCLESSNKEIAERLFSSRLIWSSCKVCIMAQKTWEILRLLICRIEMCSVNIGCLFPDKFCRTGGLHIIPISLELGEGELSLCTWHFISRKIQFTTECFVPSHWILVDGDLFICFTAGDSVGSETGEPPLARSWNSNRCQFSGIFHFRPLTNNALHYFECHIFIECEHGLTKHYRQTFVNCSKER